MQHLEWTLIHLVWNFTGMCSLGSNLYYTNIGSDNGLAPNRWQAIFWTNNALVYKYASVDLDELSYWPQGNLTVILKNIIFKYIFKITIIIDIKTIELWPHKLFRNNNYLRLQVFISERSHPCFRPLCYLFGTKQLPEIMLICCQLKPFSDLFQCNFIWSSNILIWEN